MKRFHLFILFVVSSVIFLGCATTGDAKILHGVPSAERWSVTDVYEPIEIPTLSMVPGEDFRILVLADIQLGLNPFKNAHSYKIIAAMVEKADADLILTVGDNVSWFFSPGLTKKLIKRLDSYKIPWAVTLGNHDSESYADRIWHGNRYVEGEYSLFEMGPGNIQGIGNFAINIHDEEELVYSLILMDSNEYREYEDGKDYDYIHQDQIDWYRWMIKGANGSAGKLVPSLAFFHIPLPEFEDAVNAWNAGEIDSSLGFGETREGVFCAPENSGFFDVIREEESTTHIFNGHDHVNNLSVLWEGIRMTYALKTGPGSYSDEDLWGATLVIIDGSNYEVDVEHLYLEQK